MMISQNNKTLLGAMLVAGMFSLAAPMGMAQTQEQSAQEQNEANVRPFFGSTNVPNIERDQATGKPLNIVPGPYIAPGTIERDPFAPIAPQYYQDKNNFNTNPETTLTTPNANVASQYGTGVLENTLAEMDPESLGLLEERSGGMPYDMWAGSSYPRVVNIINNLPVATLSPTMNMLSELLLLSAAKTPDGKITEADSPQYQLLLARLNKFSQTGKVRQLNDFLRALPSTIDAEKLLELRVNAALLSGDTLSACNIAQDARTQEGATYWLKVLTYCRAVEGNRTGANFNISILQETSEAPALFINLINDILKRAEGQNPSIGTSYQLEPQELTPLSIAMVNTAKGEIPLNSLQAMPKLLLASMTKRADLSIDFRADISELAALYGVLDGRAFSEVLAAMEFTDGERGSIFLLANTDLGARVDGLLINSALYEPDELRKTELISTALERALRQNLLPALAAPLLDVIKTIEPKAELAFFAHDAARIALYAGDKVTAQKWYDLVLGLASRSNFEANRALVSLWPLFAIDDKEDSIPVNDDILNIWSQSLNQLDPQEQSKRKEILLALLDVFGKTASDSQWDGLLNIGVNSEPNPMVSHAVWRAFLASAQAGKFGETLGLGIMALGNKGLGQVNISVLTSVLSVLNAMGLGDDARALALEALIENGV